MLVSRKRKVPFTLVALSAALVACGEAPSTADETATEDVRACGHRRPCDAGTDGPVADAASDATAAHSVALQWVASTTPGVTYDLFRASVSGGPYAQTQSGITTTSTVDTNVISGATYYYVVRSHDGAGESASSNEVRAVVP